MTQKESGHFAAKHPDGTRVDPRVRQAVADRLTDGQITCVTAHEVAQSLQVKPSEIGIAIDLQEGRIIKCQMGLFGYSKGVKKVKAALNVDPGVQQAITAHLVDGRLACVDAWRLAQTHGMPRLAMANACEFLGVKIKPCQLGAF